MTAPTDEDGHVDGPRTLSCEGKYTPGPWEAVLPDDKRGQPVPYYRGLICCVSHEHPSGMLAVVTGDGRAVPKANWVANARLIAVAPDMADAGKCVLNYAGIDAWLDAPGNDADVWGIRKEDLRKLRAAIAKATAP